jgi:hypothetical protein
MKEITIYCYNRCTTCKKAEKYLEEKATKNKNIVIIKKDIITEHPKKEEMERLIEIKAGSVFDITKDDMRKFFNTSRNII